MSGPTLVEPAEGLFVLYTEYEDRAIPKRAGLRWHVGDKCKRKACPACAQDLGRLWFTVDLLKALELVDFAEEELRGTIVERAGPAAEEREEAERAAVRATKIRLLEKTRTLQASRAADAEVDAPSPEGREYLPYQRAAIAFGDIVWCVFVHFCFGA